MKYNQYGFSAKMWMTTGKGAWHFVTVPVDISDDIKKNFGDMARGWGSLPVNVTIGVTTWKTSIFPDKKLNAYILPVKGEVRVAEKIKAEDTISMLLEVRV